MRYLSMKNKEVNLLRIGKFRISVPITQKKNWEFWMALIRTIGTIAVFAKAIGWF